MNQKPLRYIYIYVLWEQRLALLEASPQTKILATPRGQLGEAVTLPCAVLILDSAPRGQN